VAGAVLGRRGQAAGHELEHAGALLGRAHAARLSPSLAGPADPPAHARSASSGAGNRCGRAPTPRRAPPAGAARRRAS
jgi:hypothetical protein